MSCRDKKYKMGDKIVVIAPPGSGKTELCRKYPDIFTELHSEYYEFEHDKSFEEVKGFYDPWWPLNYANAIELMMDMDGMFGSTSKILFVSSHLEVAKCLSDRGIKFCFLCPIDSTVIDNCKKSKYNSWFIEYMKDNWSENKNKIINLPQCKSVLMYSCSLEDLFFYNNNDTYADIMKNFIMEE